MKAKRRKVKSGKKLTKQKKQQIQPKKNGKVRKSRLTIDGVSDALREHYGNMASVGRKFGVHRSTVLHFCRAHAILEELRGECTETMIDKVESRLFEDCLKNSPAYQTSRIFFLKTRGKGRGYIERTELAGTPGSPVIHEHQFPQLPDRERIDAILGCLGECDAFVIGAAAQVDDAEADEVHTLPPAPKANGVPAPE